MTTTPPPSGEDFRNVVNELVMFHGVHPKAAEKQAYEILDVDHWCQLFQPNIIDSTPSTCFRCGKHVPLQRGMPVQEGVSEDEMTQRDNNVELIFDGGYGQFVDHLDTSARMFLCHECGHELAEFLNLDVRNWHTHDPESGQHPDHHNWEESLDGI